MATIKSYTDEIWKDVVGWEGLYQVSSYGRVKSFRKREPRLLSTCVGTHGYCVVLLHDGNGQRKNERVHRLVAQAFIPNPNNYPYINHKDEDKTNNQVENLEWCTPKYNLNYGTAIKRRSEAIKASPVKQRKAVIQLSLSGEFIKEYRSTKEASEETSIDRRRISCAINHVGKQARGYLWVLKDNYNIDIDYGEIYKKESMHPKPKRIAQYTKDGIFIKEWDSLKEAHLNLGINYSSLTNCLHGRYSHAGGFVWKFI